MKRRAFYVKSAMADKASALTTLLHVYRIRADWQAVSVASFSRDVPMLYSRANVVQSVETYVSLSAQVDNFVNQSPTITWALSPQSPRYDELSA